MIYVMQWNCTLKKRTGISQTYMESGSAASFPRPLHEGVSKLEYCLAKLPTTPKIRQAVARVKLAYEKDDRPWIIGYSGGKDSSAVLRIVFHALRLAEFHHKLVSVVYCDTGVEIPAASALARVVIEGYQREAQSMGLPISTKILQPRVADRFFVKVIGRGYPPPTDKFRWCTDRLRINPVSDFLRSIDSSEAVVLLGVRELESATRSLTLKQNSSGDRFWKNQKKHADRVLFMPILDFSIEDVWQTLLLIPTPASIQGHRVAELYSTASGECPTIRDPVSPPCGTARFGCWCCTVAKKTETLANFVGAGETKYADLASYRRWLQATRNSPSNRWKRRRNGQLGLGPMTMAWRRDALKRLLDIQNRTGLVLLSKIEEEAIQVLWAKERP